jgi:hypothetical protein
MAKAEKLTILGNIREEHTEAWQRELFDDSSISDTEKFESLAAAGVDEIKWSRSLNQEYADWMYLSVK